MAYDHQSIEPKWQTWWGESGTFHAAEDASKPKYYVLCMFPYPSGSGLHVGHPLGYTAVDIVARYKRMQGFSVLNPIGFDSFGLPAERSAQRENRHPAEITRENIAYFRKQLQSLGFSFNWEREVSTCEVDYYRWTQWIFLKLHEKGLAYLAEVPVNWCPAQGTVLANEEVVDGRYVETGDPVERRLMKQWMLKITAYAQRLIDDLDELDWPPGILKQQRDWIGRSEGAEVRFAVADHDDEAFVVYTTRPDTLFGATYCVLAPEHALVAKITTDDQRAEVEAYVDQARNRSDMDRQLAAEKEKTGVFTGAYAINPVNGERVPVWVADYVLVTYGTGAIMAVPAHDERDHAFATKFGIEIRPVYDPGNGHDFTAAAWPGEGKAVGSGEFDGFTVEQFKPAIIDWLEANGHGERKINYKLRDWLFSRQRYWGEPFPIVHLDSGEIVPLRTSDLPVELPHVDAFKPTADGKPPLARADEGWLRTEVDGNAGTRETNTMPQWAGSCWYYLRYMDPHNESLPFSPEAVKYWHNVDLYIGGAEHAVLHLLYARFWHKVLYDSELVPTKEPFQRLYNNGMIQSYAYRETSGKYHHPDNVEQRDAAVEIKSAHDDKMVKTDWYTVEGDVPVEQTLGKMGKSLNNSVDPLEIVEQYGADTLRTYLMFMGPLDQAKPWQTSGCDGIHRFLSRVWRLYVDDEAGARPFGASSEDVRRALHVAIKEATDGCETLKLNTPVSKMMEFVNACKGQLPSKDESLDFLRILSPFAPHLAEELWSKLGHDTSVALEAWPTVDESALVRAEIEMAVQVNGKVRARITVPADADKDTVLAVAKADENVARHLDGKALRREIVVPGKLVNLVVG